MMSQWDESVDLLVIGSGAAGLSGAIRAHDLGLKALVIEKTDLYGGNSAMSGGICWIANNPDMQRVGIEDSDEEGLRYLQEITQGEVPLERLRSYITESKRALAYLQENTELRYVSLEKYTDYYPEAPGGKPGGRSMDPVPFDGAKLGEHLMLLRRAHHQSQIMGKFGITARQAQAALGVGLKTMLFMAWQMFLYFLRHFKRKRWGRDTKLTAGNALMGRLLYSLLERKIPTWRNTSLESLLIENGRVIGAVINKEGQSRRIEAKKGVLLAAGGFSRNQEMRDRYQRQPIKIEWTAGSPENTGDAIRLGEQAGATLALMDEAWWTPVCMVPKSPVAWVLVVEKSLPHGIFVNQEGKRFTNEAAPYIDVVQGLYQDAERTGAGANARWYHVFDATYRQSSISGPIAPGKVMPDHRVSKKYRDGRFLYKADSLEELAQKLELPFEELKSTILRFNTQALRGQDPDFGRGKSAQDRYYGDPNVKPNCALGPVESAPFYAVEIFPGDLGTKGGLVTDAHARVLNAASQPIPGLYAAGNTSASIMGRSYPGAGGTIAPALTFGFLAAEAAAQQTTEREKLGAPAAQTSSTSSLPLSAQE